MAQENILVVDDDVDIQELVKYNLEQNGYPTRCVGTGDDALARARKELPDLIVLDLMLPDVDGLSVCRALKRDANTSSIPIIMLTAKGEEVDVVTGLEVGADDYIVKPFSPRILLARLRAALRSGEQKAETEDAEEIVKLDELSLMPASREARVDDTPVNLTFTEFEILRHMLNHPDRVFSRTQLIEAVRGEGDSVTERAIDVQILGLRRKLGRFSNRLETVRGVGYRLKRENPG